MPVLNNADAIRHGPTAVDAIYRGSTLVWPLEPVDASLTIAAGEVSSDLTGFVSRVNLADMPAAWWTDVDADGGNVRVKQSGSVIPFDLVSINTATRTGNVFVKATLNSGTDNVFTIDKTGTGLLAATDPNGRNAVWSDYAAVLVGATSPINRVNGAAFSTSGTVSATADNWLDTPGGGNGYLYLDSLTKFTTWTMGASVIPDAGALSGDDHFISYGTTGSTSNTYVATANLNSGVYRLWNSTDGFLSGGPSGATGVRKRINYTHNGTTARTLFVDGAQAATGATAQRPGLNGDRLYIGTGVTGSTNSYDGKLNYAYLRSGVLSAAWLAAEYASWETPASFYTVS